VTDSAAPEGGTSTSPSPDRPLGYWLKTADEALTLAVSAAQQDNGVTRLEWQVLHSIGSAGSLDLPHLMRRLQPLGPLEQISEILGRFLDEGWLEESTEGPRGTSVFQLTPLGRGRHEATSLRQEEVRRSALSGIPAEDYETAIRVLERLVANLTPGAESRTVP
jgi:DNA-binding MarR family transcriptional regulator